MDSTVTATAGSFLEVLTVAQRDAARRVAAVLAPEGFTVEQWRILRALADGEGHAMGELSSSLRIPGPTLTRLVDALVDESLVYRRQSREDRRSLGVHLARVGRARLDLLDALVAAQEDALRATPEWQALARLVDRPVGA